jgi:hypothetical protein
MAQDLSRAIPTHFAHPVRGSAGFASWASNRGANVFPRPDRSKRAWLFPGKLQFAPGLQRAGKLRLQMVESVAYGSAFASPVAFFRLLT